MAETYDVVIAGAGAGGSFAAMALAERGFKVLILEKGKRHNFREDFPMNHPDWELQPKAFNPGSGIFDYTGAPRIRSEDHDLCSGRYRQGGRLVQNTPKHRGRFQYQRALGVGGSTLHYQGEAHRYPEHAFKSHSLFGWGQDWPLNYADLEPYYQQVETILGVAGEPGNPFKPARGAFPTPAHALSTRSQLVRKGADKLGWSLLPNTLALPSQSVDGRLPCQHSGGCVAGCIFGAKSSADLTAIRRAEASGNLQIKTASSLLQIETDAKGEVSGFVFDEDGKTHKATARIYMLAMGAIETPRIMLASLSARYPKGIGNQHDNVGRNFMETVAISLMCRAEQPLHSYKGPPLDARIWDFAKPEKPLRSGFVLGVAGTLSHRKSPVSYAWGVAGVGLAHKNRVRQQFGRDIQLFGIAEHIPDRGNRITLSDKLDRNGIPLVHLYSDYHAEDRRSLRAMKSRVLEWADACGLHQRTRLYSSYDQPAAAHVAGTCRMGQVPENSVTDPAGRVHGIRNLYISDASILPSLGAGDSPSLTIQALALHIAARVGKS